MRVHAHVCSEACIIKSPTACVKDNGFLSRVQRLCGLYVMRKSSQADVQPLEQAGDSCRA